MNLDLSYLIKTKIRNTEFQGLEIGGNSALPFMTENDNRAKPLLALEFLYSSPTLAQDLARQTSADIVSIKFDASEDELQAEIPKIKEFLTTLNQTVQKPLMLRGANNNDIDRTLVPVLAKYAPCESIIAFADEYTFEEIVPSVIERNHIIVLRTPIDINLAKELNILTIDKGVSPERILIDPDMGGLGYGLDYGYSIIERIKQAAFEGDTMLNMPIIAFIGEESYRAKEAKNDSFSECWGDFEQRKVMWEVSGASAMISAGADIVVLWNKDSVETLRGLV